MLSLFNLSEAENVTNYTAFSIEGIYIFLYLTVGATKSNIFLFVSALGSSQIITFIRFHEIVLFFFLLFITFLIWG